VALPEFPAAPLPADALVELATGWPLTLMVTEPLSPQEPSAQLPAAPEAALPAAGPAPAGFAAPLPAVFVVLVEAAFAPCAVLDLIRLLIMGIKLLISCEIMGPIISVPFNAAGAALEVVAV
jgi:hypothetical protein